MKKSKLRFLIIATLLTALNIIVLLYSLRSIQFAVAEVSEVTPTTSSEDFQLSPEEIQRFELVNRLLYDNGGCQLPCWWGYNVGESSEEDWLVFLVQNNLMRNGSQYDNYPNTGTLPSLMFGFRFNYEYLNLYMTSLFQHNKLRSLSITITKPNEWLPVESINMMLPGVLRQLETPPDIYMGTDDSGQWQYTNFVVMSEELNFMVNYNIKTVNPFYYTADGERRERLCLGVKDTQEILIQIDAPNIQGEVARRFEFVQRGITNNIVHTLDKTIGVDNATFIEFFKANPDGCLPIQRLFPKLTTQG